MDLMTSLILWVMCKTKLPHIEGAYLAFIKGLALLFLVAMSSCEALSLRKLRTVNMTNVLGERLELTIHCKSKDDDLGIIKIPFNGYYSFRFHPNAFDTTLFFCNTAWRGQSHWFDIYMSERDRYKCPNNYPLFQKKKKCPNNYCS